MEGVRVGDSFVRDDTFRVQAKGNEIRGDGQSIHDGDVGVCRFFLPAWVTVDGPAERDGETENKYRSCEHGITGCGGEQGKGDARRKGEHDERPRCT